MKPILHSVTFILCLSFTTIFANAQNIRLFSGEKPLPASLDKYLTKGSSFTNDNASIENLFISKPASLTLEFQFENKTWLIDLTTNDIFSKGFFVKDGNDRLQSYDRNSALHYKGKIEGSTRSFAAFSILHNEIIGVIADENGNVNIGKLNGAGYPGNETVVYRDRDVLIRPAFECGTDQLPAVDNPLPQYPGSSFTATALNTEPVDIYFEADNKCYQNNSNNLTNTVNWATSVFNIVTALYDADSIYTRMSGIKVWTIPDPYVSLTTTANVLNAFAANMANSFPGDLAHFLSQRSLGGGIAYLNVLCNIPYYRTGVSGNLTNSFTPLPAYAWNSMVITHEVGHNIATNHTQWCGWPGGAIDNCYATEGGCAAGPAPVNGGTIMSYCHLTSYGINLSNGFGPLPGATVRNAVRNSTCIYPKISFSTNTQTVIEENADVDNNCRDYKLINLKLAVNYTATQPAIISLITTNVGTPGLQIGTDKDVEVTPMNFTLNDTTPQVIQIKVYDDAIIENKESLKIDYSISANGTNAVKNGTYQLDILSLDHRPDSTVGQTVYYEPFNTIPAGWTQTIVYGASSPNRWQMGNSGDPAFVGGAAFVSMNGSSAGYAGSSLSDSAVIRLETPTINATGFSGMQLSYLYKCNGEGIAGQGTLGGTGVDFGRVYYSSNNGTTWNLLRDNIFLRNYKSADQVALPAAADNNPNLKLAFEWRNNSAVVNNPGFIVDSILVIGTGSSPVQSAAHIANIQDAYFGPDQTIHFYNPVTKNIMATLVNKTSFDFGCTTVDIVRTGNGASPAWGSADAGKIADKVFRVTTTNNNAAALYGAGLYYTAAEMNGWITATGNSLTDIGVIKTAGDLTQSPPGTTAEFSNSNLSSSYNVVDKIFTGIFTGAGELSIGKPGITPACPGDTKLLSANDAGISYQWQVNAGSGYTAVVNNAVYSGANTISLSINNAPTLWYGYKYRCVITDAMGTHNSIEYTLKFEADWLGTANNAWENTANWRCGSLPDANTDVFINNPVPFYPTVNTGTTIRSLAVRPSASITVSPSVNFVIRN